MDDKIAGSNEFKPGETIRPSNTAAEQTTQPEAAAPVTPQAPAPDTTPADEVPPEQPPVSRFQEQDQPQRDETEAISWTASEFIDHDKSLDWYLGLGVAGILSAVILYFLFKDIITSITPLVAVLALGLYGRRKPRQLAYKLDSQGITIAEKFFPYELFRSFAVLEEGPFASIAFLPMKRFGLLTTVYLDPQDEDRIIRLISQYLPFEPREHDAVDRLMKKIRF